MAAVAAFALAALFVSHRFLTSSTRSAHSRAPISAPGAQGSIPGSGCKPASEDFADQELDLDQFGTIRLKKGFYAKADELGNVDWEFTLENGLLEFNLGLDVIEIVRIDADHVGGSGHWYLAIGYACSDGKLEKALEVSSLGPIDIAAKGSDTLLFTVLRTYQGAGAPQGRKVVTAVWNPRSRRFAVSEAN